MRIVCHLEFWGLGKADWKPSSLQEKQWVGAVRGRETPLNDISQKPGERDHRSRTWSLEGGEFYLLSW